MLDHVTYLYGFNPRYAEILVKDVPAEQMAAQPGGVINHPAWCLGHLAGAAGSLGQMLGLEPSLPEGWGETFQTGGEPSGDVSAYPTKEEILGALEAQHARNTEGVRTMDVSRFAEPHPDEQTRKYFPTLGDHIVFMMTSHEMDHLGQIAAWRRAMGLGPATGIRPVRGEYRTDQSHSQEPPIIASAPEGKRSYAQLNRYGMTREGP